MKLQIQFGVAPAVFAVMALASAPAFAEETAEVLEQTGEQQLTKAANSPTRFLPGAIAPDAGTARVWALGWGGYDGATETPLMGATAEARLTSRLVLGAGAVYAPAAYGHPGVVRPSVALRLQVMDQRRHGVDGGVAVAYREDRFVGEEGFIQATFALGHRGERNTFLANVSYGQDGEGDDFEGELRTAILRRFGQRTNLGIDGRFRKSLWSTDARGNPSLEYRVTPVVAYGIGPMSLTAAAGVTGVKIDRYLNGFVALGGVGALF